MSAVQLIKYHGPPCFTPTFLWIISSKTIHWVCDRGFKIVKLNFFFFFFLFKFHTLNFNRTYKIIVFFYPWGTFCGFRCPVVLVEGSVSCDEDVPATTTCLQLVLVCPPGHHSSWWDVLVVFPPGPPGLPDPPDPPGAPHPPPVPDRQEGVLAGAKGQSCHQPPGILGSHTMRGVCIKV